MVLAPRQSWLMTKWFCQSTRTIPPRSCSQSTRTAVSCSGKSSGPASFPVTQPRLSINPNRARSRLSCPNRFSFQLTPVADGKRVWWVKGLACEMKSIASHDAEYLYINGWGFPQNQQGQQLKTISWEEGLARYDKNGDKEIAKTEISGTEKIDRMLSGAFEAFDMDRNEKLNARDWEVFRAMMAAENGLLSIKMGGEGDQTANAIRWHYYKPVPQVPSTLLYKSVLYMINDSGILLSFDPATGNMLKQGRLHGAIDKYFASPVAADDKVLSDRPGWPGLCAESRR